MPVSGNPTARGHFNNFPRITAEMRVKSDAVVQAAAFNIAQRIVDSFSGPKSGRIYTVAGRSHQASAPGEAPAVLYGTFANSVHVAHPEQGKAVVYSNDEKGPYLEFGTRSMAPRPSFAPAAEAERAAFAGAMRAVFGEAR